MFFKIFWRKHFQRAILDWMIWTRICTCKVYTSFPGSLEIPNLWEKSEGNPSVDGSLAFFWHTFRTQNVQRFAAEFDLDLIYPGCLLPPGRFQNHILPCLPTTFFSGASGVFRRKSQPQTLFVFAIGRSKVCLFSNCPVERVKGWNIGPFSESGRWTSFVLLDGIMDLNKS